MLDLPDEGQGIVVGSDVYGNDLLGSTVIVKSSDQLSDWYILKNCSDPFSNVRR